MAKQIGNNHVDAHNARAEAFARAGNYVAPVDTAGMDEAMKASMLGTPMDKTESAYVASRGGAPSATEAVRRARRANRQRPLAE